MINGYPRPQLVRPDWLDLAGPWQFAYDDNDRGLDENWQTRTDVFDRIIQVPYAPEAPASGIGDTGFHPVVWYRREVDLNPEERKRNLLHGEGIDYRAQVWVNGQLVATHEGGYTRFSADITGALRDDGKQVIVVRAEDPPRDLTIPRGKQEWRESLHEIWYHRTTGIWRPIWLETVSENHIAALRWTPNARDARLTLRLRIRRRTDTRLRLRVQLALDGVSLADDIYTVLGAEIEREITLARLEREEMLWTPERPRLIDARLTLLDEHRMVDEVESYAGLRDVTTANGQVRLNGYPCYLRLALEQMYWPQTHFSAPDDEALCREVRLAKELGFNGVRVHQTVADPRFLAWCDRLGLLVWGEMPSAYVYTEDAARRLTVQWMDVLERDSSHPCIIAWVPLNESWGVTDMANRPAQLHLVRALYHLTKALDPARPVSANDGWEFLEGDILGVHDYAQNPDVLRARYGDAAKLQSTLQHVLLGGRPCLLPGHCWDEQPVILSEFGGITLEPKPGEPWFGYGTVPSSAAFLRKYCELLDAVLDCGPLAGFCYTQLTDTEQETNGLLTADRQPKASIAELHACTSKVRPRWTP